MTSSGAVNGLDLNTNLVYLDDSPKTLQGNYKFEGDVCIKNLVVSASPSSYWNWPLIKPSVKATLSLALALSSVGRLLVMEMMPMVKALSMVSLSLS